MVTLYALFMGLLLGMRHATDADHVLTIATIVRAEEGLGRCLRVAAVWGLGHTITFMLVGLAIILAGWTIPAAFETLTELAVATLLVGLGVSHFVRPHAQELNPPVAAPLTRPFLAGTIHGMAGSATVALVILATLPTAADRLGYLILFGMGTVLGMMAITVSMLVPLKALARRSRAWLSWLRTGACTASIALGMIMVVGVLQHTGKGLQ